jgi:hypothetical protein
VSQQDRDKRTVYRLSAADLDSLAGRELTEEELTTFEKAIEWSSAGEVVQTILDSMGLTPSEDEDEDDEAHTLVPEGTVDGVEYVTVLDAGGNPIEYNVRRAQAEKDYLCG